MLKNMIFKVLKILLILVNPYGVNYIQITCDIIYLKINILFELFI